MTIWFTVQLDDRPGALAQVAQALADRGVNITGIVGVAEDTDGALMLTTSDAAATREAFTALGHRVRRARPDERRRAHRPLDQRRRRRPRGLSADAPPHARSRSRPRSPSASRSSTSPGRSPSIAARRRAASAAASGRCPPCAAAGRRPASSPTPGHRRGGARGRGRATSTRWSRRSSRLREVVAIRLTRPLGKVFGKRVIVVGGGAQVAQVALGAVTEADRHNLRGERISVDTIPLVGEEQHRVRRARRRGPAARPDARPRGLDHGRRDQQGRGRAARGRHPDHRAQHGRARSRTTWTSWSATRSRPARWRSWRSPTRRPSTSRQQRGRRY